MLSAFWLGMRHSRGAGLFVPRVAQRLEAHLLDQTSLDGGHRVVRHLAKPSDPRIHAQVLHKKGGNTKNNNSGVHDHPFASFSVQGLLPLHANGTI